MPPKSSTAKAPESAPRRSSRLSAAPPSKVESASTDAGKKRPASKPTSAAPASKKTKAAPTSSKGKAPTTTKKGQTNGKAAEAIAEEDEAEDKSKGTEDEGKTKEQEAKEKGVEVDQTKQAAKEEKEAEAPADADADAVAGADGDEDEGTDGKKRINEGDVLPDIKLVDEEGKEVLVKDLAKEKGAVIFLYPKANTPGCTTQACGFRDAFKEIQALGYDVYGLSRDNPGPQKNWKEKKNLQYRLLCDPSSEFIKRLGAFVRPKNTKRSHFVFEKGGKLVQAAIGVKPVDDPTNTLKFIQSLAK